MVRRTERPAALIALAAALAASAPAALRAAPSDDPAALRAAPAAPPAGAGAPAPPAGTMVGPGVSTQPAPTPGAAAPGQPIKGLTVVDTAQPARVTAAPGQGFTVTTGEGFAATLRPRIQLRQTVGLSPGDVTSETQVRTLRLNLGGHVYSPELLYFVQLAFGGNDFDRDSSSPIFDAFVEHAGARDARLRVGQFFVPFDRARTVREFALQLVDRQQAVRELSLDRDVGVMLWSPDLLGAKVAGYHVFLGSGEGRNRFGAQASGPLAVVRLVLRPFGLFDDDTEGDLARRPSPKVALGAAGAFNWSAARAQSTLGAALTGGKSDFRHGAVDLVLKWRGVSLLAEALYRQASVDRLSAGTADKPTTEWTRSGWGYFVQAGVMLTDRLELVGRWDELRARAGTDPTLATLVTQQGRQAVAGANYYLHGHAFKVQGDYTHATGPAGEPRRMARLQLDASF